MFGLQWNDDPSQEISVSRTTELREAIENGWIVNLDGSQSGVFGVPMLIEAIQNRCQESVEILLSHGASPDVVHTHGDTALHLLLREGALDSPLIPLLVNHGADLVIQNADGAPPFAFCPPHKLSQFDDLLNDRVRDDPDYFVGAWSAFKKGMKEASQINSQYASWMSQFFLQVNPSYASQLSALVTHRQANPYISCVQQEDVHTFAKLIDQRVDGLNQPDTNGMTPLHYAVQRNSTKMVRLLCRNPNISIDKMTMETPLHLAARLGYQELVSILLDFHADPRILCVFEEQHKQFYRMEYKEETPLHLAARYNHLECLRLLLNHDPLASMIDNRFGNLPLHVAAMNGFVEGVQVLLENNTARGRIDFQNTRGDTALHYAYRHSHSQETISLLKSFGANETITNDRGHVPEGPRHQKRKNRKQPRKPRPSRGKRSHPPSQRPSVPVESPAPQANLRESSFDPSCVVCLDEAKNVLFIPCKHIATCGTCASELSQCPLCRQEIVDRMTVFIS